MQSAVDEHGDGIRWTDRNPIELHVHLAVPTDAQTPSGVNEFGDEHCEVAGVSPPREIEAAQGARSDHDAGLGIDRLEGGDEGVRWTDARRQPADGGERMPRQVGGVGGAGDHAGGMACHQRLPAVRRGVANFVDERRGLGREARAARHLGSGLGARHAGAEVHGSAEQRHHERPAPWRSGQDHPDGRRRQAVMPAPTAGRIRRH
ncbi:MAG: hypothetical protein INH34_02100 [Phycisphaerales bacterium]|nr:hypothetical protein [Phycisphaerales bacterium]